jgi:hypothetical protein
MINSTVAVAGCHGEGRNRINIASSALENV